jgi:hypothetical protein
MREFPGNKAHPGREELQRRDRHCFTDEAQAGSGDFIFEAQRDRYVVGVEKMVCGETDLVHHRRDLEHHRRVEAGRTPRLWLPSRTDGSIRSICAKGIPC